MELKTQCNNCSEEFMLDANSVKEKLIVVKEDDKPIYITYYECPKCKKVFVVQIDTTETKNILIDIKHYLRMSVVKQNKKQQMKKKDSAKCMELNRNLDKTRLSLASQYNNKHYVENGQVIELSMSMLGGGVDDKD